MAHLQAFLPVQTVNAFVINLPAFASQQHMNALVAVADSGCRYLANALAKNLLLYLAALVVVRRAACAQNRTRSANTDPIPDSQVIDQFPPASRP